jgi:hypothetical protein
MAKRRGFTPEVQQAIDNAARQHGLNPKALQAFARIESSGNPSVQTGSYKGLFQLSNAEFRKYGGKGDIFDPVENANAAGAKLAAETKRLERSLGRTPTAGDVYLVHQQGEGGSMMHRRNPDQPAWKSMFATGEGQSKGEGWSKKAIWGNIPNADKQRFGSVENVTSRDFMKLWQDKVAKFGGVKDPTQLTMRATDSDKLLAGTIPPEISQNAVKLMDGKDQPVSTVEPNKYAAAVSPEGLDPVQKGDAVEAAEAVAQAAPDMAGPLSPAIEGDMGGGGEVQPVLPTPTETPIAGANPSGGGLLASLGIGGLFGGKGGGGGFRPPAQSAPLPDTTASYASLERAMGGGGPEEEVRFSGLPPMPPPPPPTPPGLPVADWTKRRKPSRAG